MIFCKVLKRFVGFLPQSGTVILFFWALEMLEWEHIPRWYADSTVVPGGNTDIGTGLVVEDDITVLVVGRCLIHNPFAQ